MKRILFALFGIALSGSIVLAAGENGPLNDMIVEFLTERGSTVQLAPPNQLTRRMSIDLTGVTPTLADMEATEAMSPEQMFDYYVGIGPMPHTGGISAYAWVNLLHDADEFLFSNSVQFSQVTHIQEYNTQLERLYSEDWSYQEFTRWALTSQMFLNRFPSGADRANAAFFLFLGRDSFSNEVPAGNMWNGYVLRNPNLDASDAETNPDYHVYDYDPSRCGTEVICEAELWSQVGSTPEAVIGQIVESPLFAEAVVERYWQRMIGTPLPGVDFPVIRTSLAQNLIANNYSVNWLIREIATSPAYTQEMMFR
ncbi:MAG: DUF1549 domain-containing protein [Myxococcales bacterium]|nr:DUF1549 domain-containing protein [Myxococcales bacterium]